MPQTLLEVSKLAVSFDGFKALDINHFAMDELELRVVIGPNGAGKTTFMDVLCGKTKPDTGTAELDGKDLVKMSQTEIVDMGVGRKFQTPTVFGSLSVWDNLKLAYKTNRGVFASLFHKESKAQKEKVLQIAERIGLIDFLQIKAGSLSHGQKQWLEIGMVLLMEPKLLLIDEPAAGMTDAETEKTGELLIELSNNHSIIVIEHDMEFVKQIARTVTVLCEGRILTEGSMDEIQNNEEVIERYLGRPRKKAA